MTSSHIWFSWNLHTNLQRAYLSCKPNLIKHKRVDIMENRINRGVWNKWILSHCDLDLWFKVTNFNRVQVSVVSNRLAKTASKSVRLFDWNFVHKQIRTHTHTHTHTHTYIHTYKHTHTHLSHKNIIIPSHVHTHKHIHIPLPAIHTHTHTPTHIHTHTHTHTLTNTQSLVWQMYT